VSPDRRFTLYERLRYRFDTMMARGTVTVIAWLFVLSLGLVLGVASVVHAFGWAPDVNGRRPGFWDVVWMSLMRSMDAGTMGNDAGSWPYLFAMLTVTTGGVFVVGTLIGLISAAINRRLEELRKGRSLVVESDHVVLLGWSPGIFSLVRELIAAGSARSRSCIAILAERDKVWMEDELRAHVGADARARVVCRTGHPTDPADVAIVNPQGARALVVLPDPTGSDVRVIKTLFALAGLPGMQPMSSRIVTAVRDPRHADEVRMASGEGARVVVADDVVARVIAQTARQPGLFRVYAELLDFFEGNDIYFVERRELAGKTFGHALSAYENATPIGICTVAGEVTLCPDRTRVLTATDRLIVLTEAPDRIRAARGNPSIDSTCISRRDAAPAVCDRILLLNWNRRAPLVLRELDRWAVPGSTLTVLTDHPRATIEIDELRPSLQRSTVILKPGHVRERAALETAQPASYDRVLILADADRLSPDDADAASLVSLMHTRALVATGGSTVSICAEVLESATRELAESAGAHDVVAGDRVISMLLAQLAENPRITRVLDELFDARGCDVQLRPIGGYVTPGAPVTFHTAGEAAQRSNEIALGYRSFAHTRDHHRPGTVVLNPPKSSRITFTDDDLLIVLGDRSARQE
jgi:voltage-gated potassium channel Kch